MLGTKNLYLLIFYVDVLHKLGFSINISLFGRKRLLIIVEALDCLEKVLVQPLRCARKT